MGVLIGAMTQVKLWPCQFLYIEGFFLAFPQAISFGCHCAPGWWVLSQ